MKLSLMVASIALLFGACQSDTREVSQTARPGPATVELTDSSPDPASPHSEDKGIGPVKNVKLGPLNEEMAEKGKQIFDNNCSSCHALNYRKIGPPLGEVTKQRTPEFIMNLLLNTSEMENKDPAMKELEAKYGLRMPNLDLDRTQARDVLEYLRSVAK